MTGTPDMAGETLATEAGLAGEMSLAAEAVLTGEARPAEDDHGTDDDDDSPQPQLGAADPGLLMVPQVPPPPPPPPVAASSDSCETSTIAPAAVAIPAIPSGEAAPPVAPHPGEHDPDNLVEALGLRPVSPQAVMPAAPVLPVQQQASLAADPVAPQAMTAVEQPERTAPVAAAAPSATQPITAAGPHTQAADPTRQIAMRLKRAVNSGEDILTIELHPAELGRVSVRLGFHEGRVDVRLVVDQRSTFDAFSQDRAALEQQLAQAGIDLGGGGLDLRFGGGSETTPENRPASTASTDPIATTHPVRLLAEGLVDIVA